VEWWHKTRSFEYFKNSTDAHSKHNFLLQVTCLNCIYCFWKSNCLCSPFPKIFALMLLIVPEYKTHFTLFSLQVYAGIPNPEPFCQARCYCGEKCHCMKRV